MESERVKLSNTAAIKANVMDNISMLMSYEVRRDSNPPAGTAERNTDLRAQLAYQFDDEGENP